MTRSGGSFSVYMNMIRIWGRFFRKYESAWGVRRYLEGFVTGRLLRSFEVGETPDLYK
jgi:hypothetical protein